MRSPDVLIALAISCLLVLFRSAVFVFYEQAHFDSDQAVVGLMARDIVTFSGFPLFFYGQQYLLGIESWVAAPFLLLLGTTVFALKLPLLLVNMLIAALLVVTLIKEAGLTTPAAAAASLFVALPFPIAASRMLEASGGQLEPFVWVLVLWLLRHRAFWFGVTLGIGVLNREFTVYAPVALAIIAASQRRLFNRDVLRRALFAAAGAAVVFTLVQLLIPFSTNYFPAVRQPDVSLPGLPAIASRIVPLATDNLAVVFGLRRDGLANFNIRSALDTGHPWLVVVLGIAAAVIVGRMSFAKIGPAQRSSFAIYLSLVGLQAVVAPLVLTESGGMLIRYTLLSAFLVVGLAALYLRRETNVAWRAALLGLLFVWGAASASDHVRLAHEYGTRRPANVFRELALHLEQHGHRYGWADYWTAYHVTFLSDTRVVLTPSDVVRIDRYRQLVEANRDSAIRIQRDPCDGGTRLRQWYICK